MTTAELCAEIEAERGRQDVKWGQQNWSPPLYFAILGEEVGEAAKEIVEATFAKTRIDRIERLDKARTELIQAAAVCVAMVEAVDRDLAGVIDTFSVLPPRLP